MLVTMLFAGEALASRIVINEIYRDTSLSSTGTEWMEVVLLEDLTSAELEGFFFGDSTSATASKFSGYRLQNAADFATVFPAGTVLVLGGAAGPAEDLTYDPAAGDWNLVLHTSNVHVLSNGSSGDFAGTDVAYVDTNGTNGDITLSADGFALNWDTSPGTFGAVASALIAVPPNPGAMANLDDLVNAAVAASWAAPNAVTPGAGNGGANDTAIDALRSGGACADADLDGVCDADDRCQGSDDSFDADGDGTPDGCDLCQGADDAFDVDGDSVPDGCDVCPGGDDFADADADGVPDACDVCLGGDDFADDDGDGTPDDCDLQLEVSGSVSPGQIVTLTAVRANPAESVRFVASPGGVGVGPCPPALGGHCFDLGNPINSLGSDAADPNGTAVFQFVLPAAVAVGSPVTFQAAVVRGAGGVDSDLTQPVTVIVQP